MDNRSSFSATSVDYLASVWLQQQDLSKKRAVEIADMYYRAYEEIKQKYNVTAVTGSITHR